MDLLNAQAKALQITLGNALIPTLTKMVSGLNDTAAALQKVIGGTTDWGDAMRKALAIAGAAVGVLPPNLLDLLGTPSTRSGSAGAPSRFGLLGATGTPLPKNLFNTSTGRRRRTQEPLTPFEELQQALALLEQQRSIREGLG